MIVVRGTHKAMPAKLDKRLILAEWMLSQFGFANSQVGMKELSGILRDQKVGLSLIHI